MDIDYYIDKFLMFLRMNRGLSQNTIESYASDLRGLVDFLKERDLCSSNIGEYIEKKLLGRYKSSTINRKLSAIRLFLRFIERYEDIDISYRDIKNVKHQRKIPNYVSFENIKPAFSKDRDGLIVLLIYASGLRVSEVSELRISDIFFDMGFIRVKGKGSKERVVPLDSGTLKLIDCYIKNERGKYAKQNSSDFLFLSNRGHRLTRQALWKIVKKKFLKLGIRISPHSLRHLFATHMIENGASLRAVQEMLGHESITTTQIYTDISDSALEKEFHRLEILK